MEQEMTISERIVSMNFLPIIEAFLLENPICFIGPADEIRHMDAIYPSPEKWKRFEREIIEQGIEFGDERSLYVVGKNIVGITTALMFSKYSL